MSDLTCRDCGRRSASWYWRSLSGHRMKTPRCPDCHEQAVRDSACPDEEMGGMIMIQGPRQRLLGKMRRGVYEYSEEL